MSADTRRIDAIKENNHKEFQSYQHMLKQLWYNRYDEGVDRAFMVNVRGIILAELLRCRKNMRRHM